MRIKLKLLTPLKEKTKYSELILEFDNPKITLIELFNYLKIKFPIIYEEICTHQNTLITGITCIINKNIVYANSLHKEILQNEDKITFSLAIGGGIN
jgi:molybdopterin converting factor small subunit